MIVDEGTTRRFDTTMTAVEEHEENVLRQRRQLMQSWEESSRPIANMQKRLGGLSAVILSLTSFDFTHYNYHKRSPSLDLISGLVPLELASYDPDWSVVDRMLSEGDGETRVVLGYEFHEETTSLKKVVHDSISRAASKRMNANLLKQAAANYRSLFQLVANVQAAVDGLEGAIAAAVAERDKKAAAARGRAESAIKQTREVAIAAQERLPAGLQAWSSEAWDYERLRLPTISHLPLYGGTLVLGRDERMGPANADFAHDETFMAVFNRDTNMIVISEDTNRDTTTEFVQSQLVRELTSEEPGMARIVVIDPVGLGASVSGILGLAEYSSDLIGGQVWSSTEHIGIQLDLLVAHVELVTQRYLGSRFASVEEYNEVAQETAVGYTTLVVFDYPSGFREELQDKLVRVMLNGPRCGIRTIVTGATSKTSDRVSIMHLPSDTYRLTLGAPLGRLFEGDQLSLTFSPSLISELAPERLGRVVEGIGKRANARVERAVSFGRVFSTFQAEVGSGRKSVLTGLPTGVDHQDPDTWWRGSTTGSVIAPVGAKGATETASLVFDSSDHAGALLVGRPGSGKSTLLHTFIAGATTMYGPDELELYLIDFKEGVEFKGYATRQLPHARCVATESDREFGLSILESLQTEIGHRAELLRATGGTHSSLESIRQATDQTLPRVVLIFDEFQVLFAQQDKIGLAAAHLLEQIIRQGRGFGIHVLLGSQSLAGLDALGSHVLQLLPVRILLPASQEDTYKVLGDTNTGGNYLSKAGEGILNSSGGQVEANEPFQGALIDEEERIGRIKQLRELADQRGFTQVPVVFEGNGSAPLDTTPPAQFVEDMATRTQRQVRLRVGAPMALHGTADLTLRREAGANVLVVARQGNDLTSTGIPRALLTTTVLSAAIASIDTTIVDFTPIDEDLHSHFMNLVGDQPARVLRRRQFPDYLQALVEETRTRIKHEDTSTDTPTKLLVLYGIHKARDINIECLALDGDPDLGATLEELLLDGPEMGIHTWVWGETVAGITRRLSTKSIREFGWRIVAQTNQDDSLTLLGNDQATTLRTNQIILTNDDDGTSIRCRVYTPPPPTWIAQLHTTTEP